MTNPLDHLDAMRAGPLLGDVTLSDEQAELDVIVSWQRRKRVAANAIARGRAPAAASANARAARGTVVEVDIYHDKAIVVVDSGASRQLGGGHVRIDAAKMEFGMWDVLEAGDVVEFDFGPGLCAGRRARFADAEKRLRRR